MLKAWLDKVVFPQEGSPPKIIGIQKFILSCKHLICF